MLLENSLKSMFDLGNTPFVPNQHIHNLRFINQENSNSRYRNLLIKGFGNQLFDSNNYISQAIASDISLVLAEMRRSKPNLSPCEVKKLSA